MKNLTRIILLQLDMGVFFVKTSLSFDISKILSCLCKYLASAHLEKCTIRNDKTNVRLTKLNLIGFKIILLQVYRQVKNFKFSFSQIAYTNVKSS